MASARLVNLVIFAISLVITSRLLTPADFGHFAIAMAAYTVLQSIAGFGLRQFVIRAETQLDRAALQAVAGLSMTVAIAVAAVTAALVLVLPETWLPGPAAGALLALIPALLIRPFTFANEAQLQRAMAFKVMARSEMLSAVTGLVVVLPLALAGLGALAPALAVVASQVAVAIYLVFAAKGFERVWPRPVLRARAGAGRFGSLLTTINLLPPLTDLMLLAALGSVAGAAAVGLYNRAKTIRDLLDHTLLNGIGPVILPAISGALRNGKAPAQVLSVKYTYLTALCWPAFGFIALLADPLVLILLGTQWTEAVTAVQLLALGGFAAPFSAMSLKFFTAINMLQPYLRIQVLQQVFRVLAGSAAALVSLELFCAVLSVAIFLKAAMVVTWTHRHVPGANEGTGAICGRSALICAVTLAGPAAIVALTGLGPVALLSACVGMAVPAWLGAVMVTGHPFAAEIRNALGKIRPS